MEKVSKAVKHYYENRFFTKELLLGVEDEVPGSLSGDLVLDSMDSRAVVDDKLYKQILGIQLDQMKDSLESSKED